MSTNYRLATSASPNHDTAKNIAVKVATLNPSKKRRILTFVSSFISFSPFLFDCCQVYCQHAGKQKGHCQSKANRLYDYKAFTAFHVIGNEHGHDDQKKAKDNPTKPKRHTVKKPVNQTKSSIKFINHFSPFG